MSKTEKSIHLDQSAIMMGIAAILVTTGSKYFAMAFVVLGMIEFGQYAMKKRQWYNEDIESMEMDSHE